MDYHPRKMSKLELRELIAESKSKSLIKDMIKQVNKELNELVVDRRNLEWTDVIDNLIQEKLEQKKHLESLIVPKKKVTHPGTITDEDIARVKSIPMDQILDFNRLQKALCIWHNEKSPSLHWYKDTNTVKCFGCGEFADTIKVIMQEKKLSFIEAVKYGIHIY